MANLYSSLTDSGSQPSPGAQWVYASDQYAIYEIEPTVVPNTRAKWDRVGHTIMNSINPDYVMIRSNDGVILMVVGNTRWDAASLKQTMNRECFQAEDGDVSYAVNAGTGYFGDRVDDATDLTYLGNSKKLIVDENFSHWRNFPDVIDNVGADFFMFRTRTSANAANTEDNWSNTGLGERDLVAEASKTTNYNLGNYSTGRYNEFPLDLPITSGSNLRLYHLDLNEITVGDGTDNNTNLVTGATSQTGAKTSNIYDRDGYFSQMVGHINPLMYTFMRSHDTGAAHNRLVYFAETDSYTPGGEYGLQRSVNGFGGDFDGDGDAFEPRAGLMVVPIAFTATA